MKREALWAISSTYPQHLRDGCTDYRELGHKQWTLKKTYIVENSSYKYKFLHFPSEIWIENLSEFILDNSENYIYETRK